MAYTGLLTLGDTVLLDACRTVAFGQSSTTGGTCLDCIANDCGCCAPLHQENFYTDVAGTGGGTPAPWYDPATPESEGFFGLLATSVVGLEPGDITRDITPRADGMGGLLGREVQAAAVITIRALVMASDCCAAEFGMRWLGTELRNICQPCGGSDLVFYTCCPGECIDSPGGGGGTNSCDRFRRTMYGVSMINSPRIIDEALADPESECGCVYEIEFQLGAANPCQYGEATELVTGAIFTPDETDDCRFTWVTEAECAEAGCGGAGNPCFDNPGCPPTILPPQPVSPTLCDSCDPWNISSLCEELDTTSVPLHAEGIPILTLHSGSSPMRATTIRFFAGELPVEECDAYSEITITWLPEDATLVIDGVRQEITLSCAGSEPVDASRLVAAGGGTLPFSWPVITCHGPTWTVCADTDSDVAAVDAALDIALAFRECG